MGDNGDMEQVLIQHCGCIALSQSIIMALALQRGMTLEVALNGTRDAVLLTPRSGVRALLRDDAPSQSLPTTSCVILPPSR